MNALLFHSKCSLPAQMCMWKLKVLHSIWPDVCKRKMEMQKISNREHRESKSELNPIDVSCQHIFRPIQFQQITRTRVRFKLSFVFFSSASSLSVVWKCWTTTKSQHVFTICTLLIWKRFAMYTANYKYNINNTRANIIYTYFLFYSSIPFFIFIFDLSRESEDTEKKKKNIYKRI